MTLYPIHPERHQQRVTTCSETASRWAPPAMAWLLAWALLLALMLVGLLQVPLHAASDSRQSSQALRAEAARQQGREMVRQADTGVQKDGGGGDDGGGSGSGGGSGGGSGSGGGEDVEFTGLLVGPTSSFDGPWNVTRSDGVVITLHFTTTTRFDDFEGVSLADSLWLEIRGVPITPREILALRVRPDEFEDQQLVVRLAVGTDVTAFADQYDLELAQHVLTSTNIMLFNTDDDEDLSLTALEDDPRVVWAEFNFIGRLPEGNPYRTWEWGTGEPSDYVNESALQQVHGTGAYGDGAGVIVAVLDTGIYSAHPALAGSVLPGRDLISNTHRAPDASPGLSRGHGTHVAGVVHSIAPGAKLLPVRVLDGNGRGNIFVLAAGIEWAAVHGAHVVNLSLGADCGSRVLADTVAGAIARGVTIVAAAGNSGNSQPQCPASLPGVLAVTAVNDQNLRPDWASFGAGWVDLAAPGVGITSTMPPIEPGGLYAAWSGSSMAAPFVSGAAALARALLPQDADPIEIPQLLLDSGEDIVPGNPVDEPDPIGRLLHVQRALDTLRPITYDHQLHLPLLARP